MSRAGFVLTTSGPVEESEIERFLSYTGGTWRMPTGTGGGLTGEAADWLPWALLLGGGLAYYGYKKSQRGKKKRGSK